MRASWREQQCLETNSARQGPPARFPSLLGVVTVTGSECKSAASIQQERLAVVALSINYVSLCFSIRL